MVRNMAKYEFVRRLAREVPAGVTETVAAALLENGIEVYALNAGETGVPDSVRYVSADAFTRFPNGEIYVPAADRERAIELLERAGAIRYLCDDPVEALEMTEAEKMQADMLRRHRRNMVICLVLIVLAAIYYAFF